ncbi:MAG: hypothetical protein EPO65_06890 [Dehalococcoidia bacterium]|nr:MAG: hypothetical protein EPO65_06890 [Dehalococcoidia bacterium]
MTRWVARIKIVACWCGSRVQAGWRAAATRLWPWQPVVIVDAKRSRARRLRRMVVRTTRAQFKALGVAPPEHLLLVVQRIVQCERPVASLLQVFDGRDGMRRHVLYLAFVVGEESMSDGEIVATLRQQLYEVVGDALGPMVRAVPATTAQPRPAAVVPFRSPAPEPPPFEDDDAPPLDDSWVPMDGGAVAAAADR